MSMSMKNLTEADPVIMFQVFVSANIFPPCTGLPEDLLTGAALDQDQMIAVTGPDRSVHLADLGIEHHLIEFLDHLSRSDHAEIAAQAPGGTFGMGSGALGEAFAHLDAGFQLFAGFFVGHQDVQNVGHGHGVLLSKFRLIGSAARFYNVSGSAARTTA
jgi:hypothetical protein